MSSMISALGRSMILPAMFAAVVAASTAEAQGDGRPMEVAREADRKTITGPADWFTGKVTISGQFQRADPSRVGGAVVSFEPGARTAWHKHPLGQTLIVTRGVGWTQVEGTPVLEFHAGDILWCPPDQKHWHGATPYSSMTHIAIQESENGSPVTWLDHVTDEQYRKGTALIRAAMRLHRLSLGRSA